jgi:hypothetical protein
MTEERILFTLRSMQRIVPLQRTHLLPFSMETYSPNKAAIYRFFRTLGAGVLGIAIPGLISLLSDIHFTDPRIIAAVPIITALLAALDKYLRAS